MKRMTSSCEAEIRSLVNVALGNEKADLAVVNGDLVNVYTRELLRGWSVAIKGERIAYVGNDASHTIGPQTRVIDASGKTLKQRRSPSRSAMRVSPKTGRTGGSTFIFENPRRKLGGASVEEIGIVSPMG